MTETSLRAYIREIDNLIEQEKLDEAIAHCRHILQSYPKHIDCYRLLGKAYLEAKRFGDAADIFQRVLSAVPDDFVSHIGMSLVREDEGNIDAAIWHMERAFETNPANPAIQQELKRLIGQRDGFEPHKVRLTRGALARMYAHGELYPQAIAELRSALQEDPDRPDLQVLLAEMYWQTDHRQEAASVSGDVLKKLPYCLAATRITAAVLQARGKTEEAAAYHRRLAQLEPYLAYSEVPMIEATRIDSDSIVLDKLSWRPGQPLPAAEAGPTDWATSLGLEPDEGGGPGTGPLPSWLEEMEPEAAPEGAPSADMAEPAASAEAEGAEAEEGAEIPDWMADAGWQESSGEAEERPVSFSAEELDALEQGELPAASAPEGADTDELEPAEIPGWLAGMAPPEEDSSAEEDEELEAILRSEEPAPTEIGAAPETEAAGPLAEDEPLEALEDEASGIPAWLDEGEPGATSTIMSWLGDREESAAEIGATGEDEPSDLMIEDELEPEGEAEAAAAPSEQEVPGWLSGVAEAAADAGESQEEELAQFRREFSAEEPAGEAESDTGSSEGVPDWLQSITGDEAAAETGALEEEEEGFAWEAEVAAAEQETVPQPDEADAVGPSEPGAPEWLASFRQGDEPAPDETDQEEDWLAGLGEETGAEADQAEPASWLERLGEPAASEEAPAAAEGPVPDWMEGLAEEEPEPAGEEVEQIASTWLDDLSETLAETPAEPEGDVGIEAPTEEAPEWLAALGGEAERQEEAEAMADEDQRAQVDELAWLETLDAEAPATDLPPEGQLEAEAETAAEAAEFDSLDEDDVFSWLDQMAAEAEQAEAAGPLEDQHTAPAAEVSDEAPPESLEEGLDWLERLADARGIDADVTIPPTAAPAEPESAAEPAAAEDERAEEPSLAPGPAEFEGEPPPTIRAEPTPETQWAPAVPEEEEPEPADEAIEPEPTILATDMPPQPASPPAGEPVEPAMGLEEPAPAEPEPERELGPKAGEAVEEEVPDWLREHGEGVSLGDAPSAAPEPMEEAPEEPAVEPATVSEPAPPPAAVPEEPSPAPPPAPPDVERALDPSLQAAREALQAGDRESAARRYGELIKKRRELQVVVQDLEQALEEDPDAPPLWQTLGDAYMRLNRSKDAVKAYNRGMEETEVLDSARQALAAGDVQRAAAQYGILIKRRTELDIIIDDLEQAVNTGDGQPALWQALGDAYMKAGRVDDSIQAYRQGMESV